MFFFAELEATEVTRAEHLVPWESVSFHLRGVSVGPQRVGVQRWRRKLPMGKNSMEKTNVFLLAESLLVVVGKTSLGDFGIIGWSRWWFWIMFDPFFSSCSGNGWKRFFIPCCCPSNLSSFEGRRFTRWSGRRRRSLSFRWNTWLGWNQTNHLGSMEFPR